MTLIAYRIRRRVQSQALAATGIGDLWTSRRAGGSRWMQARHTPGNSLWDNAFKADCCNSCARCGDASKAACWHGRSGPGL